MNYDELDPGIRDTVRLLREHGFDTTDSGDGVSKPDMECAMDCPNVAMMTTREGLLAEGDRLATVLGSEWSIQASYDPRDGSCILLATQRDPPSSLPTRETV